VTVEHGNELHRVAAVATRTALALGIFLMAGCQPGVQDPRPSPSPTHGDLHIPGLLGRIPEDLGVPGFRFYS